MALKHSLFKLSVFFCLILLLNACSDGETDPETQLRETVNAIQQAAESRDLSEMMRHVSDNYLDTAGRDSRQVKIIAQVQLLRNPKIHTFKVIKSINLISEQEADVSLLVAIASTPIDGVSSLVDVRADMMRFDLRFRHDQEWKLTAAIWRPAESADFL